MGLEVVEGHALILYHHDEYIEEVITWVGFSFSDDELPEDAVEYLKRHYP